MTTVPADPDVGRCPICHGPLPSRRASYCSAACRIRAHRQRHAAPPRPLQQRPAPTPAEGPSSVRLDLLAAQVSALAGQVAELAAVVAQLTDGRESQSPPPVGGEAVEREAPPPPAPEPEPLDPGPGVVEAGSTPSVWAPSGPVVLGLWPVGRARGILADLDRTLTMTEAELAEHLKQRGIPRPVFDNYLKRELAKWLELAKLRPAEPREAMATLAAELRGTLGERPEAEAVPGS